MQFVLGRKLLQSAPSPLYSLLFSMCLAVLNCFTLILGTKNLFFFSLVNILYLRSRICKFSNTLIFHKLDKKAFRLLFPRVK